MRDRNIIVVYALGALAIVGGIALYNTSKDDVPDGQVESGPTRRGEAEQGILIDLALPESFFEREQPEESPPARRVPAAPATYTPRSAAGGSAPAPVTRPALVTAPPACVPSLLGSVLGLLGALLGGGGGC
ncbi:MAG TPA: hypothetical protein VL595_27680 [Pseudonocardia sp.]|jgi:hypothetical protein|nr:hypothetical protein [Pseudonocardia sp.]